MGPVIVHPETEEQSDALTAFLKAFKVKFEVPSKKQSPYNAEFVSKIEASKKQARDGKTIKLTLDEIWPE